MAETMGLLLFLYQTSRIKIGITELEFCVCGTAKAGKIKSKGSTFFMIAKENKSQKSKTSHQRLLECDESIYSKQGSVSEE